MTATRLGCSCDRVRFTDGRRAVHPFDAAKDCSHCWAWWAVPAVNRARGGTGTLPVARPHAGVAPCRHLGPATGRTVSCPTCSGRVELKTFACAVHGECTAGKAAPGVACCTGCPDHSTAPLLTLDETTLWPGVPGWRFNTAVTPWQDGYAIATRTGWAGSNVLVGMLDREFRPAGGCVRLPLHHPAALYGREDPRLFLFRGQLHVSFVGVVGRARGVHTSQLYARLGAGPLLPVEAVFHPREEPGRWQKNWAFFGCDGDLYAVYSISPHRVLRVDGGSVTASYQTANPMRWAGGEPRGGAPPFRVGDEYAHVFHDRVGPDRNPTYRVGVYCFEARPPFRVTRYVPDPVLVADPRTNTHKNYADVLFPCGAFLLGGDLIVAGGEHDRRTRIDRLPWAAVARRLVPA